MGHGNIHPINVGNKQFTILTTLGEIPGHWALRALYVNVASKFHSEKNSPE